jgi:hypothetical protein
MNHKKINHPYQVPDHFFNDFKSGILEQIEAEPPNQKLKSVVLLIAKYAAIIVISFILGRESSSIFREKTAKYNEQEIYNVENVLSQVSDDDITDYLIENVSEDFLQ